MCVKSDLNILKLAAELHGTFSLCVNISNVRIWCSKPNNKFRAENLPTFPVDFCLLYCLYVSSRAWTSLFIS